MEVTVKRGWLLYGWAWTLAVVRHLDTLLAEKDARIQTLENQLLEWQGKHLEKTGQTKLFYQPEKSEPVEVPPIGTAQKRARLAQVPVTGERSDEEILEAAREAHAKSAAGNGGG